RLSADIFPVLPGLTRLERFPGLLIAAGHEIIGGVNEDIDAFHLPGGRRRCVIGYAIQVFCPGVPGKVLPKAVIQFFVRYGKQIYTEWTPGRGGGWNCRYAPIRDVLP